MKNKIITVLAAFSAFLLPACVSETPQQLIATGIYASGYAAASDNLNHDSSLIATIQDVAAKLPLVNSGKLTSTDYGVLAGELQKLAANNMLLTNILPADSAKLQQANSFLFGVIQSNAALNGGRAPTTDQVVATVALTDFANGLIDGVGYWQGKNSVAK